MDRKEKEFHRELLLKSDRAKKECKYNASYYNQMLATIGGVKTARQLIAKAIQTQNPSDGFATLMILGRTDLTMESSVVKEEYKELFTDEEVAYCLSVLGSDQRMNFLCSKEV